jgi:hypothetical protein
MPDQQLHSEQSVLERLGRRLLGAVSRYAAAVIQSTVVQWTMIGTGLLAASGTTLLATLAKHAVVWPLLLIGAVLVLAGVSGAWHTRQVDRLRKRRQEAQDTLMDRVSRRITQAANLGGDLIVNLKHEVLPVVADGLGTLLATRRGRPLVAVGIAECHNGTARLTLDPGNAAIALGANGTARLFGEDLGELLGRKARLAWCQEAHVWVEQIVDGKTCKWLFAISSVPLDDPRAGEPSVPESLKEIAHMLGPMFVGRRLGRRRPENLLGGRR